jgi:UDP-N-acetylmuramoyl-L-alanyl-D-glutamate--2,6-diaminopimelate ligase
MMLLKDLLATYLTDVDSTMMINAMTLDSRQVEQGGLFFSLAKHVDARMSYLQQSIEFGAAVVMSDADIELSSPEIELLEQADVAHYQLADLASHVSSLAARFYHQPSSKMTVIAITGTNGKTSVSHYIAQALSELDYKPAVIGTLGVGQLGKLISTGMTTPDPVSLQATLANFVEQGVTHVVMEASSHALAQDRLSSVDIDIAVFTNLSRDHLEYHHDMVNYGLAKQRLFEFTSLQSVIINQADSFGQKLLEFVAARPVTVISYGHELADLNATHVDCDLSGISCELNYAEQHTTVATQLLGRFNIDNLLASIAALLSIGISFEKACDAVQNLTAVDGRMQSVHKEGKPHVVIDFAHTPDALSKVLSSLRQHVAGNSHLWCVFGCGGDRDKGKRPLMGKVAEQQADKIVLTADNPRSEDNRAIVDDILAGIVNPEPIHIEHDRAIAIAYAVDHAGSDDVVLVAGKGHEDYQEILGVKKPFSDIQAVLRSLAAANDATQTSLEVQR